jgi:outer membrane protein assembly factor BamB
MTRACNYFVFAVLLVSSIASAEVGGSHLIDSLAAARHGLKRAWFAHLEVGGGRSPIVDVKFDEGTLFVQTGIATTHAIDGETGRTLWVADVGSADQPSLPLGVSDKRVALLNGTTLFVLDRASGQVQFTVRTRGVPSAGAALTDDAVFVPNASGQVETYSITADDHRNVSNLRLTGRNSTQPVVSDIGVAWGSDAGDIALAVKDGKSLFFRNSTNFAFLASPAARGQYVYAGSIGGLLHHFSDISGRERWTFAVGSAINQPPLAFADAVYVLCEDMSMYRVSVESGREDWMARNIKKFFATSPTKVYALDRLGRLVVLDAKSGSMIDRVSLPPIAFPVSNSHSDQIFLVTQRGLIQSLHEIELTKRLDYRAPKEESAAKPARSTPPTAKDGKSKAAKANDIEDKPAAAKQDPPRANPPPPQAADPFAPEATPDPFGGK